MTGITPPFAIAALALILAGFLIAFHFWRRRPPAGRIPESIMVLLRQPKPMNVQTLARLLSEVTGVAVEAVPREEAGNKANGGQPVGDMVTGSTPIFIALVQGTCYLFHNPPFPCIKNAEKASKSIRELRIRKAFAEHKGFIGMDIFRSEPSPQAYRVVARVLARLIDDDCLGLYHPPRTCFALGPIDQIRARLNSDDPIHELFTELPVSPVMPFDDDPRL